MVFDRSRFYVQTKVFSDVWLKETQCERNIEVQKSESLLTDEEMEYKD